MMDEQFKIAEELRKAFGINAPDIISKEAIIGQLELTLSQLIEKQPELFFQLMYRLDISERRLNDSLADRDHSISRIANLVYDRQLQKIQSRQENAANKTDEPDLNW